MATILRAPVFSTSPRRPSQPADIWPNLLLSTLSLIVHPTLFDNPRVPRTGGQTEVLGTPLLLLAQPAQQQPVGQNDPLDRCQPRVITQPQDSNGPRSLLLTLPPAQLLPIGENSLDDFGPPRVITQPQDSNGPRSLLLTLPPAQLLPVGENNLDDFGQPRVITQPQDSNGPRSLLLTLTPAQLLPVGENNLDDFGQPRVITQPQDSNGLRSLLLTLTPAQLLPIGANGPDLGCQPRSRAPAQADAPVNLLTSTLSPSQVTLPFLPPDWPQVRVTLRAQDATSSRWLGLALPPVPLPFLAAPDLAQPRARAGWQADASANLLLSTLAPVQGSQPFLALDWPQPRVARPSQDLTLAGPLVLNLPPAQLLPIGQNGHDWSQPGTARRPQADVGPNLLASTLATQRPFVVIPDACQGRVPRAAQDTSAPNTLLLIAPPISLALRHPDLTQPRRLVQPQDWTPPNVLLRTLQPGPGKQLPGAVVFVLEPELQAISLTAQDLALSVDNDGTEVQVGADDRHLTVYID